MCVYTCVNIYIYITDDEYYICVCLHACLDTCHAISYLQLVFAHVLSSGTVYTCVLIHTHDR